MKKTKNLKKKRKNKTFKGGSNQSEKQLEQKMRLRDYEEVNNLRSENQIKGSKINQLSGEIKRCRENITELESQLNEVRSENENINTNHQTLNDQHQTLREQHQTLSIDNSNNMQTLTASLKEKDKKIFYLWNVVCNYLTYTNSLHDNLNKDISIQKNITNDLNNRIKIKRRFDEWWNKSVKDKIPFCDNGISLEMWLEEDKSDHIM